MICATAHIILKHILDQIGVLPLYIPCTIAQLVLSPLIINFSSLAPIGYYPPHSVFYKCFTTPKVGDMGVLTGIL